MLQKTLSIIIILSLIVTGCIATLPSAEKVLKKMEDAESYSSDARMAVKNNKSVFYYNLKQYYKKQGKFRIEFCNDDGVIKQTMIYNNGQCGIFHTDIDKPFKTNNFTDTKEHNSFLQAFIENYKNASDARWDLEVRKDGEFYAYQCSIDNENPYFKRAILLVNPKDAHPILLNIFGEDDSKTLEVEYNNFQYNIALDDLLFNIE